MSQNALTERVADRAKVPGDLRSVVGRHIRHLAAWRLSACLAALGFSAELVAWLTGEQLLVTGVVALGSLGTAAIAAAKAQKQSESKGRRTLLGGLSSATWLTIASLGAPAAPLIGVLMLGTLSLNARRFHQIRLPYPDLQPAIEAAPPMLALEAGKFDAMWDDHIGCSGGPLPGSFVYDANPFEYGTAYSGQLVRGKQDLGSVTMALPKIASGLDVPMERLVVDADRKKPSRFVLKVVTRSPIEKPVLFDEPRYRDGKILLGPHADGIGDAFWRLYSPDSMWGGVVYGGTGIGKSRLVETIALTAMACTPTVVFYIDGQDGNSSPALYEHATWSGGPAEAPEMLAAIERIQRYRQKYNRLHRLSGFTPTPEMPGILVIIEECHGIYDDKTAKRHGRIAREGRKVGIVEVADTQNPNVGDSFAGQEALRQSLQDGNTIVMRCQSRTAGIVVPGIDIDLSKLPAMPGYGVPVPSDPEFGRSVPFRNRWLLTQSNIDDNPALSGRRTVDDWFAQTQQHELDKGSANAAGLVFTERKAIAAQRRAALEVEMEALENGTFDFEDDEPQEVTTSRWGAPVASKPVEVRSNVVAFPTIGAPTATSRPNLTGNANRIIELMFEGATSPAEFQARGPMSESGAIKCVKDLLSRGLIERSRHGEYRLTREGQSTAREAGVRTG